MTRAQFMEASRVYRMPEAFYEALALAFDTTLESETRSLKDQNESLKGLLREALPWLEDLKDQRQSQDHIISADMIRVLNARIQQVLNDDTKETLNR